jgi:hypothetical protein
MIEQAMRAANRRRSRLSAGFFSIRAFAQCAKSHLKKGDCGKIARPTVQHNRNSV